MSILDVWWYIKKRSGCKNTSFFLDREILFILRVSIEARAVALCHRNIVEIYDVGEEDDFYYIVMEYVRGQTLKEFN